MTRAGTVLYIFNAQVIAEHVGIVFVFEAQPRGSDHRQQLSSPTEGLMTDTVSDDSQGA